MLKKISGKIEIQRFSHETFSWIISEGVGNIYAELRAVEPSKDGLNKEKTALKKAIFSQVSG